MLLQNCPICAARELIPRFRVAFPEFGPNWSRAWPLDVEPPVPFWTIVACRDCGVWFPNPFPSKETIEGFYSDQQTADDWTQTHYVEATADRTEMWSSFVEKITRVVGAPGDLLEIGPAAGHLLDAARAQGWNVFGVEATPKFANVMRDRGIPTHLGTIATLDTDRRFDAVAMIDVIEHLHDPVADLERCASLLKPNGLAVIATCDCGSLAARYYGLRWRQIVISHTFYWTRRSLTIALRRAGFEPVQVSSVRWWDTDRRRQALSWMREFAKLLVRKGVQLTWVRLAGRSDSLQRFQRRRPKLERWLEYSIGDQAVMSEVILVVARRAD